MNSRKPCDSHKIYQSHLLFELCYRYSCPISVKVAIIYKKQVGRAWLDSQRLKFAFCTERFACAATHAMLFVQHAAESAAIRV